MKGVFIIKFRFFSTLFCPNISGQHCLIILIDKWKKIANDGGAFDGSFIDLFNTFDCLSLDLLTAELDAYGFDKNCRTK